MGRLILSRKEGQEIVIGQAGVVLEGPIVVEVMETSSKAVKLGVDAPRDVTVHRREVHERIEAEGPRSIGSEPGSQSGSETAGQDDPATERRAG